MKTEYQLALYVMDASTDRPFMGDVRIYEHMHDCTRISQVADITFAPLDDMQARIESVRDKRRRAITAELAKLDEGLDEGRGRIPNFTPLKLSDFR